MRGLRVVTLSPLEPDTLLRAGPGHCDHCWGLNTRTSGVEEISLIMENIFFRTLYNLQAEVFYLSVEAEASKARGHPIRVMRLLPMT